MKLAALLLLAACATPGRCECEPSLLIAEALPTPRQRFGPTPFPLNTGPALAPPDAGYLPDFTKFPRGARFPVAP